MELNGRYLRNKNLISDEEQKILKDKTVAVIGAGGLGGYICEALTRIGIGRLIIIDGDVFEVTNLNRQRFATESNIGLPKARVVREGLKDINSEIIIGAFEIVINEQNAMDLLKDADIVIDAVDNIPSRIMLQNVCEKLDIPLVHGAIGGWYGQVTVVYPGDRTLSRLYPDENVKGVETTLGNPSFTPMLIASYEVSQAIKVLLNRGEILRNKMIYFDLLNDQIVQLDI